MTKKKFKVEEGETLEDCLARIRAAGYTPVRRMEQPIFKEVDGEVTVSHQEIIFEAKKND